MLLLHTAAVVMVLVARARVNVSRLMNGTNFQSHNIAAGGCNPDVTSPHSTAALCQAACDRLPGKSLRVAEPIVVVMSVHATIRGQWPWP